MDWEGRITFSNLASNIKPHLPWHMTRSTEFVNHTFQIIWSSTPCPIGPEGHRQEDERSEISVSAGLLTLSPDTRQLPLVLQLRTVMSAACVGGTACCSLSCLLNTITSPVSQPTARISRVGCQHREVTRKDLSICVSGTCSPCEGQEVKPLLQRVSDELMESTSATRYKRAAY